MRLFFAPGMAHCGGGEGPNVFDALTPLEQWREQGKAPTSILATHSTNGKVDRSRPLCPFPQVAKYKGTGSIDDAANFVCAQPLGKRNGNQMNKTFIVFIAGVLFVPSLASAQAAANASCDRVAATLKLTNAKVTATTPRARGVVHAAGGRRGRRRGRSPAFQRSAAWS